VVFVAGYIPKSNEVKYLHNGVRSVLLSQPRSKFGKLINENRDRISKYEEDVFSSSSLLSLTPRVLDFENR
jgi:hypothetical protein